MMNKITEILIISGALIFLGVSLFVGQLQQPTDGLTLGAPSLSYQKSLLPITTNLYDIGSSTPSKIWNRLFVNYASTTAVTSTTASTTNAIISGLLNCDTIDTSANGTLSCGTDSTGAGADPFIWTPDGNSTSTRLIFGNGFISQASSTFTYLSSGLVGSNAGAFYNFASSSLFGFTPIGLTSLSSTFPINYNNGTGAFSFGGLSTSTDAVIGNIPYFSGVNTFANVATTSVTIGTGLSYSGTFGSVIGGVAGTLTTSLGTAIDLQSEVTDNFTDGSVLFWGTTAVSQDNASFSFNDSLNRLTVSYASTTALSGTDANFSTLTGTLQTAAQANITSLGTLTGLTISATGDLLIPSTAPNAAQEIGINSNQFQFVGANGLVQVITGTTSPAFNLGSTTQDSFGKSFSLGTTTLLMKNDPEAFTLIGFYCKATSTTATTQIANVQYGDANNNFTESAKCSTTGIYTPVSTNNTWTRFEDFIVHASSTGGDIDRITITNVITKN